MQNSFSAKLREIIYRDFSRRFIRRPLELSCKVRLRFLTRCIASFPFILSVKERSRTYHCLSVGSAETFLLQFRDTCLKNKARLTRRFFRSILRGENPRRTLERLSSFLFSSFHVQVIRKERIKRKQCVNFLSSHHLSS